MSLTIRPDTVVGVMPAMSGGVELPFTVSAGMTRYGTDEEATPTQPGLGRPSTATYPRIAQNSNQPCYTCGKKPGKVLVAVVERSPTDHMPCCEHCIKYILGYEVEVDGHLTRLPEG